ncbi:MAG: DinB family protein [Vicinamibacteraceae bacterium]
MSATDIVLTLTDTLTFNDETLDVMLTDMTDELARRRLREGGPSIAWNIGHLLHHRNQIAAAVSCRGPALDLERYARGATDGHDYPTVRELLREWKDFSARLVSRLRQLSLEELAGPSPITLPHGERTLLDALRFTTWHETVHLGQITMLRSHHGLTPTVTLILERAAAASASSTR